MKTALGFPGVRDNKNAHRNETDKKNVRHIYTIMLYRRKERGRKELVARISNMNGSPNRSTGKKKKKNSPL